VIESGADGGVAVDRVRFGWFIPTAGDTSAFGVPGAAIRPSLESFVAIARAAEEAGFEYALVPVQSLCYDAWISCAMVAAQTSRLKLLVAARPGYIQPATMAKMISTFDQLSGGRILVNLIAGPGGPEEAAEGLFLEHDDRYGVMDETVTVMRRLWTEQEPFDFAGRFFRLEAARIRPRPFQQPHPPFYLGGVSGAAKQVAGKHADVYLGWLDTVEQLRADFAEARAAACAHGREGALRFGVRGQVIVRPTEAEAWDAAHRLVEHAPEALKDTARGIWEQSQANTRMKRLAERDDNRVGPHLWSGLATVRQGAGVAIVGNPQQVADTLHEYIGLGATEFCLSGYPHAGEATRFGQLVMPLLH
jgi:alkanesulfonate monooxygenase